MLPSDDDAFTTWYTQTRPRVGVVLRLASLEDPSVAVDAADEAFTRAYERWRRVSRMGNPDGWVYKVALDVLRKRQRRRSRETPIEHPPEGSVVAREDLGRYRPRTAAKSPAANVSTAYVLKRARLAEPSGTRLEGDGITAVVLRSGSRCRAADPRPLDGCCRSKHCSPRMNGDHLGRASENRPMPTARRPLIRGLRVDHKANEPACRGPGTPLWRFAQIL